MEEEPSKTLEFGSGLWVEMILKITEKPNETIINGGMSCKDNVKK